jgi:hypothetical protein
VRWIPSSKLKRMCTFHAMFDLVTYWASLQRAVRAELADCLSLAGLPIPRKKCSKRSHPARNRTCTKKVIARVGLGFGRCCP